MKFAINLTLMTGLALSALAYPNVYNGSPIQLNHWNLDYSSVLATAMGSGRPTMIAFINAGGCSYCAKWDASSLSNPVSGWNEFLAANPMGLVWVDQARMASYNSPTWSTLLLGNNGRWSQVTAYPEVVILGPSGGKLDQFKVRGGYENNPISFIGRVRTAIGGSSTGPVIPNPSPTPGGVFPAAGAGKYAGVLLDGSDFKTVRGTLQMTATARGRISVKVQQGASSKSLAAANVTSEATDGSFEFSTGTLNVKVDAAGRFTGTFSGMPLAGSKTVSASMGPFAGYYTAALDVRNVTGEANQPEGAGYLTLTVNPTGMTKYSGMLADGTRVSGSSALMVYDGSELASFGYAGGIAGRKYACLALYKPLYRGVGALAGLIWLDAGGNPGDASDNRVAITGSEWNYPGKNAMDKFLANFDGGNKAEIGAYYMKNQAVSGVYAGMSFWVNDERAAEVVANGNSIATSTGTKPPTLRAALSTGLITGKVYDLQTGRTMTYKGVLVPSLQLGAGYYLINDTVSGLPVKRSKLIKLAD